MLVLGGELFRDRIIFPIFSSSDKCVGFGGRAFEGEPKYLNSPETKIFKKSKNLFGLNIAKNKAKTKGELILVEGYTDVMRMVENGFENTVAPLGTAFSIEQALIMKRFADIIIILFDGDEAGKRGIKRALSFLLRANLKVKVALLPENEDPDSFLRKEGREKMGRILENSSNFLDALLPQKLPDDIYAQGVLLNEFTSFISNIPSELERELFIKKLSEKFLLSPEYIRVKIEPLSNKEGGEEMLSPEFAVFGTIAAFNSFTEEDFKKRGIDERVFKSELLKDITRKVLNGESFEDVLIGLEEDKRRKIMEAIFKAKVKFSDINIKSEKESPYYFAFKKLETKMKRILRKEKIIKEWKETKNRAGSIPEGI